MIFNFRKKEREIEEKQRQADAAKIRHLKKVDKDIKQQKEVNKILSNGIVLEIKDAIGGKHGH